MHWLKHSSRQQLIEERCPALLAQAQHLFLLQKTFQLSFSQTPPTSEARIPLFVVCINKYEVSAWFSNHLPAKDKLQGFATSRAFSLPWRVRVSNVLLNDLFEVKLCPYKLPLHSPKRFSGCTTHPVIAIPDNKMTGGEHLEKNNVVIKKNHRFCLKCTSSGKRFLLLQDILKKSLAVSSAPALGGSDL